MWRGFGGYLRQHHLALLALFLALGGTSFAAARYIDGLQIRPSSIPKNRLTRSAIAELRGAKGPRGIAGPAGPRGPRGATGAQGPAGAQGVPGVPGAQGLRGPTGPAGGLATADGIEGTPCTTSDGPGTASVFYASGGPSNPASANLNGSSQWQAFVMCLRVDDLEPNNTRATETDASPFVDPNGAIWASATIHPAADEDWYTLTADLGSGLIDLYTAKPGTLMDVYEDGGASPVASGVVTYDPGSGNHRWEVRVRGTSHDLYFLGFNDSGFKADGRPASAGLERQVPQALRVQAGGRQAG
jgi:hypothetical protein